MFDQYSPIEQSSTIQLTAILENIKGHLDIIAWPIDRVTQRKSEPNIINFLPISTVIQLMSRRSNFRLNGTQQ